MNNDRFFNLPTELQIYIYDFDSTYKLLFDDVLRELRRDYWIMNVDNRMAMWIPLF